MFLSFPDSNKPQAAHQAECHQEYEKSINNDSSGWEKYAGDGKSINLIKQASKKNAEVLDREDKFFRNRLSNRMKDGAPFEVAAFQALEDCKERYAANMLEGANYLIKLASKLKKDGNEDLSKEAAQLSYDMVKEAQFGAGEGGGIRNLWNKTKNF